MTDYNKRTLITPTRDDVADFVPQKIEVEFGNIEQGQARDFRNQINCNFKGQKDAEGNVITEGVEDVVTEIDKKIDKNSETVNTAINEIWETKVGIQIGTTEPTSGSQSTGDFWFKVIE